ncbi:MAG: hypothetical protein KUG56_02705 [Kordiimonadaceae bacterium]|nr:hypothetical protein [Kordiimonadaceae bacterium]
MQKIVSIKDRFKGPPKSANGGYASGLLASMFEGGVDVSLHVPPPLDTDMILTRDGDKATLMWGDKLVGTATAKECTLEVPALPNPLVLGINPADAEGAPGAFTPFATCFVCGESRDHGDGLCLESKQVEGHQGLVAAVWRLHENLIGADGIIDPLYIWSALDCPGYFACAPGEAALLGRLNGQMLAPLGGVEDATVLAWDLTPSGAKGRKRRCGSAIYSAEGGLVAKAEGVWITVDPAHMPA